MLTSARPLIPKSLDAFFTTKFLFIERLIIKNCRFPGSNFYFFLFFLSSFISFNQFFNTTSYRFFYKTRFCPQIPCSSLEKAFVREVRLFFLKTTSFFIKKRCQTSSDIFLRIFLLCNLLFVFSLDAIERETDAQ